MMTTQLEFVFPRILHELKWDDRLTPADYDSKTLSFDECRNTVEWYFQEPSDGALFEREINQAWNTSTPNVLVRKNFEMAQRIRARGLRSEGIQSLVNQPIPEFEGIPVDADLFETSMFDNAIMNAVFRLDECRGIAVANACKLLHQKRRKLIPILDSTVRRAFDIPWPRDYLIEGHDVVTLGITQIRHTVNIGSNAATLSALVQWIDANPRLTGATPVSRLRLLDILAWGMMARADGRYS